MKTVIITGSRHWTNERIIEKVMFELLQEIGIYKFRHGRAKGADTIGNRTARYKLKLSDVKGYKANWDQYGDSAGPIRNEVMLDTEIQNEGRENIIVIAFPLGGTGTQHMINISRENNVEVRIFDKKGNRIDG